MPLTILSKIDLHDALRHRMIAMAKAEGLLVGGLPLYLPILERPEVRDPALCNWKLESVSGLTSHGKRILDQTVAELSVRYRLPPHVYGLCASSC